MKKIFLIGQILMIAASIFYYQKVESLSHIIYSETSKKLQNDVKNAIAVKKANTATIAYILSQDQQLITAFKSHDKLSINYKSMIDGIHQASNYANLWIQFIDKQGNSLYRSWTDKTGDNLLQSRMDIVKAIETKKTMNTISTGKFAMTLKNIVPIFEKGKFLGLFEVISHFNSIASKLEQQDIKPLLVISKAYSRQIEHPFSSQFIGDYYISNQNASKRLLKGLTEDTLTQILQNKEYTIYSEYLVSQYIIHDMQDNPMGHFLLFNTLDHIDMAAVNNFKIKFLLSTLLLLILLTFIIFIVIYKGYVKKLNKDVFKKTSIIKKKSDELEALVSTYDKNVIFSQTDLHGIITKVSQAFCDISGYTEDELVGANHNIVRHPDMPKSVFRQLWSVLKKEKWIKTEIKNRKKNGDYYWVSADLGPHYDLEGKHVGYSAVRQDITANKEIEEMQKEIILVMSSVGESHSTEVAQHVKRVGDYSKLLANYYGLAKSEIDMIEQASPMHDIGKIAIPDAVLKKPDKLNKEELSIMQTHTIEGFNIFSVSERPLLKMAATIALEHHEKWDGSGYPNALKGNDISIYGRITALADVFDALSFERCYKDAWDNNDVFSYIKAEKGKHFDPELVDLFFKHVDEFLKIKDKYQAAC